MNVTLKTNHITPSCGLALTLLAAGLLAACGGGGGGDSNSSGYPSGPVSCSVDNQKAWLRDYMNDKYFWYDKQGAPNEAASSSSAYLDSLLYKPKDKYSFAQSTAAFTQFFAEGTRTGYGYSAAYEDSAKTIFKMTLIEPLSPVGVAGVVRSDTVVSIDGLTPAQITAGQLARVTTTGVPRILVLKNAAGVQRTVTVQSATFPLSPIIKAEVLTAGNGAKVGYLMYQEFIASGSAALGAAFEKFRLAKVTELILDFRYNGGGSTSQARNLASMVGGMTVDGKVFANYRFSAKQAANNFVQAFSASSAPTTPLDNISRVMVITSGDTASASELVINALRPFKDVVTIGSTSFGKPYAFQPTADICGVVYNAVNIEIANAVGFADYSAGFVPKCAVADDLTRQFGDPAEGRTAAALAYISTGICPVASSEPNTNLAKNSVDTAQAAIKNGATNTNGQSFSETSPPQMLVD